jgi:hypothetical protein
MDPTSCLFGSPFACAQTEIFSTKLCSKMQERHQLFFGLQPVSREFQHPAIQTKIEQFGGFFHQINVRQSIVRQDSMQSTIEQAGGWIHFCMKRLRT